MSILLDALKKSEEQRKLGQTPGIHTPVDDGPPPRNLLQHWIPLSLVAVSAIAIAWFGWQQYRDPGAGAPAAAEKTVAAAETPDSQPPARGEPPEIGQARSAPQRPAPQQAGPDSGPARPDGRTPVENFESREEDPQQVFAPPPRREAPGDPDLSRSFQEFSDAPQSDPPGPARARPGGPSDSSSTAPDGRGAPMEPHLSEPISYWEVPQGVRDNMPEFRITVLVYADEPADRFLLMNGQRVVERDELENGLVLEEIRRDGAVFLYRNYRFMVKG